MEFALDAFRGRLSSSRPALVFHLHSRMSRSWLPFRCACANRHYQPFTVFCLASISCSTRWTAHHGLKHTGGGWGGGGNSSEPENQQRGRSTRRPNQTRFHHFCALIAINRSRHRPVSAVLKPVINSLHLDFPVCVKLNGNSLVERKCQKMIFGYKIRIS